MYFHTVHSQPVSDGEVRQSQDSQSNRTDDNSEACTRHNTSQSQLALINQWYYGQNIFGMEALSCSKPDTPRLSNQSHAYQQD